MRRIPACELLDEDLGTPEEVRASLDDLWWLNRNFGGLSSYGALLRQALGGMAVARPTGRDPAGQPVARRGGGAPGAPLPAAIRRRLRWLEVGAGTGQVTAALRRELAREGFELDAFLLDRRPSHLLGAAAPPPLPAIAGDVLRPPFADASFDLVSCSLFLHHFSGEAAVAVLAAMARLSRGAVVINDLERCWPAYVFVRLLGPFVRSRLTRYDAPVSVRQAYRLQELRQLARAAGYERFIVDRVRPYRLGLVAWVGPAKTSGRLS